MHLKLPLKGLCVLLPVILLSGCGGSPKSAGSAPPPKEEQAESYAWVGREKVGKAIALLQNGEADAARKILGEVLDRQPGDAVAQSLVKQIDGDPQLLLGAENFEYMTREGDSFSSLAQRYLGDPTLFYALARYNQIMKPSALGKGVALRIPGRRKKEAPRPQPRPEPAPSSAPVKPAAPSKPATPAADPHRAAQLRAQGLEQMNRGVISRAVALLTQASRLDPSNELIKRDLDRALRIRRTVQGN